jgi:hypothetical protein
MSRIRKFVESSLLQNEAGGRRLLSHYVADLTGTGDATSLEAPHPASAEGAVGQAVRVLTPLPRQRVIYAAGPSYTGLDRVPTSRGPIEPGTEWQVIKANRTAVFLWRGEGEEHEVIAIPRGDFNDQHFDTMSDDRRGRAEIVQALPLSVRQAVGLG